MKNCIKNWIRNIKIKKAFQPYVDKHTIKRIIKDEIDPDLNQFKKLDLEFILIKINADISKAPALAGMVINRLIPFGSTDIISNLIAVTLHWPQKNSKRNLSRKKIVGELLSVFQKQISIVHGKQKCRAGTYGTISWSRTGVLIPGFFKILIELERLTCGSELDISKLVKE